ncbi:MAG: protein translocase subunit SecD [Alphaproteobacteria bacterium]|nr:protein translocase subunit SecD [Alphaproteobacteria bacterium]
MLQIPRWRVIVVALVCLIGAIYAVPSFLSRDFADSLPRWAPRQQVTLGLDLQGGSHLLLEVDFQAVIRDRIRNIEDGIRASMRQARIAISPPQADGTSGVTVRIRDPAQLEAARNALRDLDRTAQLVSGPDQTIALRFNEQALLEERRRAVSQSVEIVRRRIDETGARDPTIQVQGQDRILVQLPGVRDPERIKGLLGRTAKLNFHLLDTQNTPADVAAGRAPGSIVLPGDRDAGGGPQQYVVLRRINVAGERLTDAQPGQNGQTGEWIVNFTFDGAGSRQFADTTRENVGRPLAIVLDNKVISAPVIREPILGGRGQISGSFTAATASDLAVLLRAGALPAPLTVIEERTVGPDLGADSIRAGAIAISIGFVLIAVLIVAGYGLFGMIANVALILNILFTLSIMAMIDATLTLPGLAGMVLGLAMSVDANVLVYERMREEAAAGRSPFPAVDVAFQRAFITILDSNLTTLIAAVFLYAFASGPVRGFAVTLAIGIICSMFTAVTVTRMLIVGWLFWRRPKQLPI